MSPKHGTCPTCRRTIKVRKDGNLYRHVYRGDDGWQHRCDHSGPPLTLPQEAATATCPSCGRIGVRLRLTGLKGHLRKHLQPISPKTWCDYYGLPATPDDLARKVLAENGINLDLLRVSAGVDEGNLTIGASGAGFYYDLGPKQRTGPAAELAEWWRTTAEREIDMVVDKAIEYGATDLRDIGRAIAEMGGRDLTHGDYDERDDAIAAETGIAFYVLGKVSRVVAAIKEGRRPSQDTWVDIGVYARMAQRVWQNGGWPGV